MWKNLVMKIYCNTPQISRLMYFWKYDVSGNKGLIDVKQKLATSSGQQDID